MAQKTLSLISILEIHNLSSGACRTLLGLLSFRNKATGQCNPKIETLGRRLGGVPDRTLRRWLGELRQAGILEVRKHRGSSSFVFHMPVEEVFHTVENDGNPMPSAAKNDRSRPAKNGHSRPAKNGRSGVATPLYEQDSIEQTELNTDDAVVTRPVCAPVETAAAAATSPAVPKTTKQPAPVPHQLQLKWDQPGLKPAAPLQMYPVLPGSPGEPPAVLRAQAEALVEELHADHPQPGLPGKAIAEAERILASADDVEATIELIRANHAAWKLHWEMQRPGSFIPQLWRWFRDGEWKRTVRKPVRHETFYERAEREREQSGGYQWTEEEQRAFERQGQREIEIAEWREKQRGKIGIAS
jgi:hypothetical protein